MKKRLTPSAVKALDPTDKPYDVHDAGCPGLAVRVLGQKSAPLKSFIVVARFPGSSNPTRVKIGSFLDSWTVQRGWEGLNDARKKARAWLDQIERGVDPRVDIERKRQAEQQKRANTFGLVAEAFIEDKLPGERRGADVAREIRKEFAAWWSRPIADITRRDVLAIIKAKKKTAPASARNILGHAKRLFQWAIDQDAYDIELSPAATISPKAILGEKIARERTLDDAEFRAFWIATDRLPYPQGEMFKLLALTGCRLAGVSDARWLEFSPAVRSAIQKRGGRPVDWSQFSPDDLWWVIPSDRVKGRNSKARPFMVPLTVDALRLLEELPAPVRGDYLFSRNGGETPAVVSTEVKDDLDAKMLEALRELAQQRGDDPADVELQPWVTHDLRRVVRSALSRLRVPQEHAEAVLGHVRPGIQGTYDQHDFFSEKRDALLAWSALARTIAEPAPAASNVVAMRPAS